MASFYTLWRMDLFEISENFEIRIGPRRLLKIEKITLTPKIAKQYINGELMSTLEGFSNEMPHKICSLDEKFLAVGYSSKTTKLGKMIRILNYMTGGVLRRLISHTGDVRALVKLTVDRLASGSQDRTIKIWNWKRADLERNLTGHTGFIQDLYFLSKQETLISCSSYEEINFWNISNGQVLKRLNVRPTKSIILLNNGRNLVCRSDDTTIKIWDVNRGVEIRTLIGHMDGVVSLLDLGKSRLASGSRDGKIKIWNHDNGNEIKTISF